MSREVEELARLASLVRKTARFLEAAAGSYSFFAFGMGIIGMVLVAASIAEIASQRSFLPYLIGVAVGALLALILIIFVTGSVWRYLLSQGLSRYPRKLNILNAISFATGFALAYTVSSIIAAWCLPVAWYMGLAVSFAMMYLLYRYVGYNIASIGITATLMALTSPVVLWAEAVKGVGNPLACGLLLLVYLVAGSYSMRVAARKLIEE